MKNYFKRLLPTASPTTAKGSISLTVPEQDATTCSLFKPDAESIGNWLDTLPRANLGQTAKQLYRASQELNKVKLAPSLRLQILELLRNPLYETTQALARHYLNQSIVLPEKAQQVTRIAHTLHEQLAIGYTIVAADTAALKQQGQHKHGDEALITAVHRAMTDYCINLCRYCQLYQTANCGLWQKLHRLYQFARHEDLLAREQSDSKMGRCSISEAYRRALLLGSCSPFQLSQNHFQPLLEICTQWAKLLKLEPPTSEHLITVNLNSDKPPGYNGAATNDSVQLGLNFSALIEELYTIAKEANSLGMVSIGEKSISAGVISHLIGCWEQQPQRKAERIDSDEQIELCVGISAAHHFIAGEISFESLLSTREMRNMHASLKNPFLKVHSGTVRQKEVWDSPYLDNVGETNVPFESIQYGHDGSFGSNDAKPEKYQRHWVDVVNTSASGFCVKWPNNTPIQVKPGELVALRESNKQHWNVAVLRWVRQSDTGPLLGLEKFNQGVVPYGGRVLQKVGQNSQYLRVLLLPEIPESKQPYTLLTPKLPFKEGHKVMLNQLGREFTIQLQTKINDSGNYCQFTFEKLGPAQPPNAPAKAGAAIGDDEDELGDLWDNL